MSESAGAVAPVGRSLGGGPSRRRGRLLSADCLTCVLLGAATIAYLWFWPRDFYLFDEGLFLYESRRLLEGAVFYRDFLEIIPPGAFYFMALLFGIFGVNLTVAKMGMAAVHAGIAILVYLCCRQSGVRRSVALTAGVAHVAIAFPGLVIASPHWFGTLLTLLVLYLCLVIDWRRPGRGLVLVGIANGALAMVQHQKGAVIAAGVGCVLVADHLFDLRAHGAGLARRERALPLRSLARRIALFAGGIAISVGPAALAMLWAAGIGPTWEALIEFPLSHYSGFAQCGAWGYAGRRSRDRLPDYVAALPFLAGLLPLRVGWSWLARKDPAAARPATVLSLLLAASALSVYYCPNYTHLSLIAPIGFVVLAEAIEAPLGALSRRFRAVSVVAALGTTAAIIALAGHARDSLERRAARYSLASETEVGLVHFRNPAEITFVQGIVERTHSGEEVFAYPTCPGIYFLSGTTNPTRYQILIPGYHGPEHFQETIDVLERRKVRFVAYQATPGRKADPVLKYTSQTYRNVRLPFAPGRFSGFALLERKKSER